MTTSLRSRWASLLDDAEPVDPPAVPTVVVSPHPDDETLMAGGLIHLQRRRGLPVVVVAVTDGGAAYPTLDVDLATIRRAEQDRAVRRLGVDALHRLGVPDGGVPAVEAQLPRILEPFMTTGCLLVAPWAHDVHSDHEAVGRACALLAQQAGVTLWEGLFWTWHRRDPADLAGRRLVRVDLTPEDVGAREDAITCHRSQVTDDLGPTPILDDDALEPMTWPTHHFLTR